MEEWKPVKGGWIANDKTGKVVRIDNVTKTGRVVVNGDQYLPEMDRWVHRVATGGRFNWKDFYYLCAPTADEIAAGEAIEAGIRARDAALKLEAEAARKSLAVLDWSKVSDFVVTRMITEANASIERGGK